MCMTHEKVNSGWTPSQSSGKCLSSLACYIKPHSTAGLLNVTQSSSPKFNFTFRMFPLQKQTTIPLFYMGCCWHGKRTVEVGQGKVLETARKNKVPSLPQALIPIWRVSARCLTENTWQLSTDEQSHSLPDLGTHSPLTPVSHRGTNTYQAELDSKATKSLWAPLGWFCVLSYCLVSFAHPERVKLPHHFVFWCQWAVHRGMPPHTHIL